MHSKIGSGFLLITGLLMCPCHLLLLLPLLLPLMERTALGGWLATHTGLVVGLSTGYFIFALITGLRMLRQQHRSGTTTDNGEGRPLQAAFYGEHV